MSSRTRLMYAVAERLGRRGFELRRHPASRRQHVLTRQGVDLVLDVGAADGGYGTSLRSFGYAGDIVSFEPQAAAFARLQATIAADARWSARHLALGPEAGELTMNIASNSTSSSMLPMLDSHIDAAPSVRYVGTETVTVARLDDEVRDVVAAHRRPFLKIDTQGFEREVLSGGQETVDACVGLQLELSLVPLYDGGMLIDEAVGWAYAQGFQMVGLEQGYAAPTGEILQIDGVFVRPDAVK
ncbi:FkbM family methyltransferase [Aeromicrobium fastidiosum]|uniref:FkbM family methyltransferase n=1 Tax=Aeromicrobium fastidiosum TaxID=52699 RepID=A0A641AS19_9ACTN|nr:FkbM family methyltransferase [Aeromicrobium fastidiosum]KAA1380749.1 FkbM family methyltransferase [Aeromicrobium fastidiosum]MBP2390368.1 FkbM family methyltransferase [Aeromicrobium fastidiosum]